MKDGFEFGDAENHASNAVFWILSLVPKTFADVWARISDDCNAPATAEVADHVRYDNVGGKESSNNDLHAPDWKTFLENIKVIIMPLVDKVKNGEAVNGIALTSHGDFIKTQILKREQSVANAEIFYGCLNINANTGKLQIGNESSGAWPGLYKK